LGEATSEGGERGKGIRT